MLADSGIRHLNSPLAVGLLLLGFAQSAFSADAQTQQYQLIKSYVDQNRTVNAQVQSLTYMLKPVEQQVYRPTPSSSSSLNSSYSTGANSGKSGARDFVPAPPRQQMLVPFGFADSDRLPTRDAEAISDDILNGIDRKTPAKSVASKAIAGSTPISGIWGSYQNAPTDSGAAAAVAKARPLAEGGSAEAMLLLATAHVLGRGARQDDQQAFQWTSRAAKSGSTFGKAQLGELYLYGIGVAADPAQALNWMKQAAEEGNARAGWRYARTLLEMNAPAGDYARALRYAMTAEATIPQAAFEVGMILAQARPGVPQDNDRAVGAFGRAAAAGNATAQYLFAVCLSAGLGVAKNPAAALGWLEKSATQGLPMAQSRLGDVYLHGDGVVADPVRAVKLLQLAADSGDAAAFNDLGVVYVDGRGVPSDLVRAVGYFRKGAELGDRDAQLNLGMAYNLGRGVAQSGPEAARWLTLAAEAGSATAQYLSGMLLLGGSGVPIDVPAGVARLRAAAGKFPPALHELCDLSMRERSGIHMDSAEFTSTLSAGVSANQSACLYVQASRLIHGILGPRDPVQAFELLMKSAELGYHQAELDLGRQYIAAAGAATGDERLDALSNARHWLARAADHGNSEATRVMQAQGWR